jgi:hypothetical protein
MKDQVREMDVNSISVELENLGWEVNVENEDDDLLVLYARRPTFVMPKRKINPYVTELTVWGDGVAALEQRRDGTREAADLTPEVFEALGVIQRNTTLITNA